MTITAIMAGLRYQRSEEWIQLLGGKSVLKDSPVYQLLMNEVERKTKQECILSLLDARFKIVPEELAAEIRAVTDLEKLSQAIRLTAQCTSLRSFRMRFKKL